MGTGSCYLSRQEHEIPMTQTLAIDFGVNNTVLSSCDDEGEEVKILHLSGWSKPVHSRGQGMSEWVIPSLIHYCPDGKQMHGEEIEAENLTNSPGTIRWMKHYINTGSPVRMTIQGKDIDYRTAGSDFLVPIVKRAVREYQLKGKEVTFTVPVDATEKYVEWIGGVTAQAGLTRYRLIDEASAALSGYRIRRRKEAAVMIFDFGGSGLEVSVVIPRIEDADHNPMCRLLGKAVDDIGGATLDQWLIRDLGGRFVLTPADLSSEVLVKSLQRVCERAKEELSYGHEVPVTFHDPTRDQTHETTITRDDFEDLLRVRGLRERIHRTIDRALQAAAQKGYTEDRIESILMVGGSSSIPVVQQMLKDRFGPDRVYCSSPGTVVACGAARHRGGQELEEYVQHTYGIRYWNSQTGEYDYRIIVRRGAGFPTRAKTAQFFVKGTYDGQTHLGISVFEMGTGTQTNPSRELLPEPGGGYRLVETTSENPVKTVNSWINEHNLTLLVASPPVKKGEIGFEVWFDIDGNKRLLISCRDVRTGRMVMERSPIVQLS